MRAGRPARRAAAGLFALVGWLAVAGSATAQEPDGPARAVDGLAGRLLVASERMDDPNFAQTVIYMIEHDREGALGLVVNRPLGEMPVTDLMAPMGRDPDAGAAVLRVYQGGPVSPGQGFFLHSRDVMLESSVALGDEIAVTGDPALLALLAEGRRPRRLLFALGYAGWGPGQLESERARGAWYDIPGDPALIFAADPAQTWSRALALREVEL